MRVFFGLLMVASLAVACVAQQEAKLLAELAASSQGVKGVPFSAEAVSESVQTLFDGNRIVQSSTSKIYRNGEGKVRREMTRGSGGMSFFNFNLEPGFSIADPSGFRYMIDPAMRTARTINVLPPTELKVRELTTLTAEQKKAVEKLRELKGHDAATLTPDQQKAAEELRAIAVKGATPVVVPGTPGVVTGAIAAQGLGTMYFGNSRQSKWETKTEELGTRSIEGIDADGTRRVTTIPADAIGNERPIEIVYERWYSKELQMVVMSKHSDPRFGEQTYTLKNVVRAEPDPSLFNVPQGFKVISESGTPAATYTVRAARAADAERTYVRTRTTQPATAPAAPKP
jgi:hypothetical protein